MMPVQTSWAAYGVNDIVLRAFDILSQISLRLDSHGCKKDGRFSFVNKQGSYGARVAMSMISKIGTTLNVERLREKVVNWGALTCVRRLIDVSDNMTFKIRWNIPSPKPPRRLPSFGASEAWLRYIQTEMGQIWLIFYSILLYHSSGRKGSSPVFIMLVSTKWWEFQVPRKPDAHWRWYYPF